MAKINKLNYKDYNKIFKTFLQNSNKNTVITTKKGNFSLKIKDYTWKQCYSQSNKARSQLPIYWFINRQGDIISFANKQNPYLLPKNKNKYGYYFYNYGVKDKETGKFKTKTIRLHNLIGIVFNCSTYGKAKELLKDKGVYAFGSKNGKELKVNGHHINDNNADNSINNIQFVSTEAHKLLDYPVKDIKSLKQFFNKFGKLAESEEPNSISIISTDDNIKQIYSTNTIKLDKHAIKQLNNIMLINKAVSLLISNYTVSFFQEPKYLTLQNDNAYIFFKVLQSDKDIHIEEVTTLKELINKSFILCRYNNNKVECFVE